MVSKENLQSDLWSERVAQMIVPLLSIVKVFDVILTCFSTKF